MFTRTGVFKEASPGSCSPLDIWQRKKQVGRDVGWICNVINVYIYRYLIFSTYHVFSFDII